MIIDNSLMLLLVQPLDNTVGFRPYEWKKAGRKQAGKVCVGRKDGKKKGREEGRRQGEKRKQKKKEGRKDRRVEGGREAEGRQGGREGAM